MESVEIFSPATIANVSCGFDIMGFPLESVGDLMKVWKTKDPGVQITEINGQDLPLEAHKNVAGVAALALLEKTDYKGGIAMSIDKRIKPGSGIGSSAASAAGAAFAVNELLDRPFNRGELVPFAMEGERLASQVAHADNVAPALLGGFTLVRSYTPLDMVGLATPNELYAIVIHPQIEVKTADSRKILKSNFTLDQGVKQWGNVAGLVAGLYTDNYELIGRSLEDYIVEPIRSILIPEFQQVKDACKKAGALGSGISGSGPSIFSLTKGEVTAKKVAQAKRDIYSKTGLDFDIHISPISKQGVKILKQT